MTDPDTQDESWQGQVQDALNRLEAASAVQFGPVLLGIPSELVGFTVTPVDGFEVWVYCPDGEEFIVVVYASGVSNEDPLHQGTLPLDVSGFSLAGAAVALTFEGMFGALTGGFERWPAPEDFARSLRPNSPPADVLPELWEGLDRAATTFLGQVDINPPVLRGYMLPESTRDVFDKYWVLRPNPELEGAYRAYLSSVEEVSS